HTGTESKKRRRLELVSPASKRQHGGCVSGWGVPTLTSPCSPPCRCRLPADPPAYHLKLYPYHTQPRAGTECFGKDILDKE
ncbi:hypothetical protein BaRGS_00008046, partial [Batillaria attramentaria]